MKSWIQYRFILVVSCMAFKIGIAQPSFSLGNTLGTGKEDSTMHVVMDISVFESEKSSSPFFKEKAEIKKDGKNYYSSFSGIELMLGTNYIVMVNAKERQVVCSSRNTALENDFSRSMLTSMDSLLRTSPTPKSIAVIDSVQQFQVLPEQGEIEQADFYVHQKGNRLVRVEYRYNNGQYALIHFVVFDRGIVFKPFEVSERKYFTEEQGNIKIREPYSRFRFVWN